MRSTPPSLTKVITPPHMYLLIIYGGLAHTLITMEVSCDV